MIGTQPRGAGRTGEFSYGAPADDAEENALAQAQSIGLGFPAEAAPAWWETAGREHLRVVRQDGRVVGGLFFVPMGQFFGGSSVSMAGIAGVAILPEARGLGAGGFLMRETVRELRGRGFALSTLYASTFPIYRSAGYEQAGHWCRYSIDASRLPAGDRTLAVRAAEEADVSRIEALYRERAAMRNGYLDRGPYIWKRVREPRRGAPRGYVAEGPSGIEGYLYVEQSKRDDGDHDLHLNDWVVATHAAAKRLVTFLADHYSMSRTLTWEGGPADPRLYGVAGRYFQVQVVEYWMLRVLDCAAALAARGYLPGVQGELHLELDDPALAAHAGRLVLRVAGGAATVEPGGEGRLRAGPRGLAPLYSGFLPAEELALAGLIHGEPAELARATALFAGPNPACPDMF